MVAAEIGVALVARDGDDVTLVLTPAPKPRPAVARRPKLSIFRMDKWWLPDFAGSVGALGRIGAVNGRATRTALV
jgi:hypothetical protein